MIIGQAVNSEDFSWFAADGLIKPLEAWFGSEAEGFGLREVQCTNPSELRLFFLSLLWRAVATSRPEFSDVNLAPGELELHPCPAGTGSLNVLESRLTLG